MFRFLARLGRDAKGATAIEYGLILAMIVLAIMGGIATLGGGVTGSWADLSNKVHNASQ
jgi:pilus assembly protein Flp/PilA